MTVSGRSTLMLFHSLLQISRETKGTSTICSRSTTSPPVFVWPHPATLHFALFFMLGSDFGSRIRWTFLFSWAFFNSWRHKKWKLKTSKDKFIAVSYPPSELRPLGRLNIYLLWGAWCRHPVLHCDKMDACMSSRCISLFYYRPSWDCGCQEQLL